jgi:hypothetical protein
MARLTTVSMTTRARNMRVGMDGGKNWVVRTRRS